MTDTERFKKLEDRVHANEIVSDWMWQFQRLVCRMFTAYLAGDDKAIKELLVMAVEAGVIRFNVDWTRQNGGSEALVDLQLELNEYYRVNQILVDFQDRVSAGFGHVSTPEVRVEKAPGGVIPARQPLPWKKQKQDSEGPTLG